MPSKHSWKRSLLCSLERTTSNHSRPTFSVRPCCRSLAALIVTDLKPVMPLETAWRHTGRSLSSAFTADFPNSLYSLPLSLKLVGHFRELSLGPTCHYIDCKRKDSCLVREGSNLSAELSQCPLLSWNFFKGTRSDKFQVGPVHEMNAYCGVEVQLHWFLASKLDGGE